MNQGGLGIYPTSQPSLTGRIGPAPAGRGWDQPNNFNGPAMAGQGYAQAGNAGGYGRGQPMSPSGNWDQSNNFNGGYQA
jgi:nucleolysin TIA-1/TIAR